MKVLSTRAILGPNVFHHRPVLIMLIDLEELTEKSSLDSEGFIDRLLEALPILNEHHCSPGHKGGFVERLHRGTYFAHIIEHIALAFSELAGIGVGYGKTIYGGKPGVYQIAVRFKSQEAMSYLLEEASNCALAIFNNESFDVTRVIEKAITIKKLHDFGPSTMSILEAADKQNIPWCKLGGLDIVQLGWGKHRRLIQATTTSNTSDIGVQIVRDKEVTKRILGNASIPVPAGRLVETKEEAFRAFQELGEGIVVKPFDGNHGRGVTLNVSSEEELSRAYDLARCESSAVLIEEYFKGRDYRIVLVDGKMVAASERIPAHVIGDGKSTIQELVDRENQNPLRGEGHEKPLTLITFDECSLLYLERKGIHLDHIPDQNEVIYLRDTANLSTGGLARDVTDFVHTEIKTMCERAARLVNLDVCGLDLVLEDIEKPLIDQKGGVIEVNAGPGIRMHHYPSAGKSRDVGAAIIGSLFKEKADGRIPVISITGTNGKTTVTRLLDHIFSSQNVCVGTTTTEGIYINGEIISHGDTTGPISARTVLSDPKVEMAILETARGGIVKRGLGYDWSDVGIITNVHADHIGQDGIESIDDILHIKSLVAERVKKGGTIILNADVPELVTLAKEKLDLTERKLVYFSLQENSEVISEHVQTGGSAFVLKNDHLVFKDQHKEEMIISIFEIPLTMGGTASFHIANALTCLAAAEALDIPRANIVRAIMSFNNNEKNQGRTNLYQIGKGHLLVDYGHNPDALVSIGSMTKKWKVSRRTGVVAAPGDRSDEMIRMSGIAAALVFDRVIIREDDDHRGREPGTVAEMICEAVKAESHTINCEIILDAREALIEAVRSMDSGELVMYFYEKFGPIESILNEIGARKVEVTALLPDHHLRHETIDTNSSLH